MQHLSNTLHAPHRAVILSQSASPTFPDLQSLVHQIHAPFRLFVSASPHQEIAQRLIRICSIDVLGPIQLEAQLQALFHARNALRPIFLRRDPVPPGLFD